METRFPLRPSRPAASPAAPFLFLAVLAVAHVARATEVAPDEPRPGEWQAWQLDQEVEQILELTPDLDNGRKLYAICAPCHEEHGWGTADGVHPQVAGQHLSVIVKQVVDIRAGNRDNPTMLAFARDSVLGGRQGLVDVAAYIASLPANPEPGLGPGERLRRGKRLYAENCARCHGEGGEGDDASFFPRIQGQHHEYVLRQLRWIRDGKRRNVYFGMARNMRDMKDADFVAVSDHVSRLPSSRGGP